MRQPRSFLIKLGMSGMFLVATALAQAGGGWTINTVAGGSVGDGGSAVEGKLFRPSDVAVDGAGNLYIADTNNHPIRRVDTGGTITTIAGTGEEGYSGDGGLAVEAQLPHV